MNKIVLRFAHRKSVTVSVQMGHRYGSIFVDLGGLYWDCRVCLDRQDQEDSMAIKELSELWGCLERKVIKVSVEPLGCKARKETWSVEYEIDLFGINMML